MPITPLHFGLLAPINHFAPGKVSNVSFILVNLWIDQAAIMYVLFGMGDVAHSTEHSFLGTYLAALIVAIFGYRSRAWVLGALLGGVSHTFLDALVHPELPIFTPFMEGNPFYMGWMEPLSMVLAVLFVWLTAQYVSGIFRFLRKTWVRYATKAAV